MNFSWPQEYMEQKESMIAFAKEELCRLGDGSFPMDLWKKCAERGIQGLSVPKIYGGHNEEVNFSRTLLLMEGLGYGCNDTGLTFGLNAQMWTVQAPINDFGTNYLKEKYLPRLCNGSLIGAHCLTEPDSGSDVYSMNTSAKRKGDFYILNGKKCLITFAPICDVAIVFAVTDPKVGKWGISAFIVESNSIGFIKGERLEKVGLKSIPIGEITFENCMVPKENLLGKEGMGFSILNHSLEYDRCTILASQLGVMERQLENVIAFTKSRRQFGKSISKFQSVSNRVVEMKVRLETSKLLLYKTAWLKENKKSSNLDFALLKYYMSESFVESSLDAFRTYGGKAYLRQNMLFDDIEDALGGIVYAGTSDIQRNIIASMLGL